MKKKIKDLNGKEIEHICLKLNEDCNACPLTSGERNGCRHIKDDEFAFNEAFIQHKINLVTEAEIEKMGKKERHQMAGYENIEAEIYQLEMEIKEMKARQQFLETEIEVEE